MTQEFKPFKKIARLSREIIITEKIDGTNASIFIGEDGEFLTASRKRWITPENDNYGFSRWAYDNKEELLKLGVGHHYGEWWGSGIQRRYAMTEKVFSLFNVHRWSNSSIRPLCCRVVPTLYKGDFNTAKIEYIITLLKEGGSFAAPNFMKPEGIVIYHPQGNIMFKKTIENDSSPKSLAKGMKNEKTNSR